MNTKIINDILWHFDVGEVVKIEPYGQGRINQTFLVEGPSEKYILQKLHNVLKPELLHDFNIVTEHLGKGGFTTPRLVKTKAGEFGLFRNDDIWRMLTYIPGSSYERGISPQLAENAAALVGTFHNTLSDLEHEFQHKIPDFHNTPVIMDKLRKTVEEHRGSEKYESLSPLVEHILGAYEDTDKKMHVLPDRIIHGDLKISNIRFDENGQSAVSLLDLDTLGRDKIPVDLGDAIRSWCNLSDEGDMTSAEFNLNIFEHMMRGYLGSAGFLTQEEKQSIPEGVETMILELAARFVVDAFKESYFRLDEARYPNLYKQNKNKAITQLNLYDDFVDKRIEAIQILNNY